MANKPADDSIRPPARPRNDHDKPTAVSLSLSIHARSGPPRVREDEKNVFFGDYRDHVERARSGSPRMMDGKLLSAVFFLCSLSTTCVCKCVFVCVRVRVCMCVCARERARLCMSVCACIHVCIHACVCVCVGVCVCVYVYVSVYVHIYMCVSMHVCTCVSVCQKHGVNRALHKRT